MALKGGVSSRDSVIKMSVNIHPLSVIFLDVFRRVCYHHPLVFFRTHRDGGGSKLYTGFVYSDVNDRGEEPE